MTMTRSGNGRAGRSLGSADVEEANDYAPGPGRRKFATPIAVLRRPVAAISLGYLVLLVFAAVAAPIVAPYESDAIDLNSVLSGPSAEHLLGTDPLGRDVLSRLMYGGRVSLVNGSIAALTFLLVGISSGLVAGFLGGWPDRVFTWIVDIVISVPALIIILVVLAIFGDNMIIGMIALGILAAPGFARVVRGVTLAIRQELYIVAARVSGLPSRHIIVKHVLPGTVGPVLVHVSLFCGAALLVDAGLAYLGFGLQAPTPTWGGMIVEAKTVIQQQPWLLVPPGVTLGLATLAFALLGDAVRDVTAERTNRVPASRDRSARHPDAVGRSAKEDDDDLRTSLLSMEGVSIALPTVNGMATVAEDINLTVEAREMVGLVGESGCGKSITGQAILGVLPNNGRVTTGSIHFENVDLPVASPRLRRSIRGSKIALVSQEPIASLDPMFTAGQQLAEMVRRHQGGSRSDVRARVVDLFESVSLPDPDHVVNRYPHELSGGMAQRVAIAIALAGEPKLLIADEPTTALDVTVQAEILQLLRQLQASRDMAILLISHDWGVIAQNCQRVYVMYAGHIVESCAVSEMLDHPSHPYTIGLLDSTPRRGRPGEHLAVIPGSVPPPDEWPHGCHFAPRCGMSTIECRRERIPLLEPVPGHLTRCIHHAQLGLGGENE